MDLWCVAPEECRVFRLEYRALAGLKTGVVTEVTPKKNQALVTASAERNQWPAHMEH